MEAPAGNRSQRTKMKLFINVPNVQKLQDQLGRSYPYRVGLKAAQTQVTNLQPELLLLILPVEHLAFVAAFVFFGLLLIPLSTWQIRN